MKTRVLVFVPYSISPDQIDSYVDSQLERHRLNENEDSPHGRFDYLVGALDTCFDDEVTEGRLPAKIRQSFPGNICEIQRLPASVSGGAMVTPEGDWNDLADFGWKMMREPSRANQAAVARWESKFRESISLHPDCWIVAVWAHS